MNLVRSGNTGIRVAAWSAVLVVLLSVFALYLRPDFMVDLAQQVWACF